MKNLKLVFWRLERDSSPEVCHLSFCIYLLILIVIFPCIVVVLYSIFNLKLFILLFFLCIFLILHFLFHECYLHDFLLLILWIYFIIYFHLFCNLLAFCSWWHQKKMNFCKYDWILLPLTFLPSAKPYYNELFSRLIIWFCYNEIISKYL